MIIYWISIGCLNWERIQLLACWWDFSREEVNDKWKGCIVFPEDTEQTGWGHPDHSLSCSDDDGAPHWITVDSASSSTSLLLLQSFLSEYMMIFHFFIEFHFQNIVYPYTKKITVKGEGFSFIASALDFSYPLLFSTI